MTNETIITLLVAGIVISKTIIGFLIYHLLKRNRQLRDEKLMLSELSLKLESYVSEVRQQNKELTRAEEFKLKILSLASHDLRSPFVNLQMLLKFRHFDGFKNEQNIDQFFHDIELQVTKGKQVVNDILLWASGQLSGGELTKENFSIKERVDSVMSFFDYQVKEKEIDVDISIDPKLSFSGNTSVFDFMLRNMISNAIKFNPFKGIIKIGVLEVSKTGSVKLFIEDNGIGLNEQEVKYINTGQANKAKHGDPEQAMGIGLSLCQSLARKTGWDFSVKSNQGKGAVFYVQLN